MLISCQLAWAQMPIVGPKTQMSSVDNIRDRQIQQEVLEKWALDQDGNKKKAEAAKESAAAQEFYARAEQFVQLWEAFAGQLNQKKTFNAKLAKQVSKAFHELEKSDGWAAGRQK
jgi:hypothetical protein